MDRKVIPISYIFLGFLIIALLIAPVVLLIVNWVAGSSEVIRFAFINQSTLFVIGKSLLMASLSALLATFIGGLCSFLLYKLNFTFNRFYKIALLLPLLISPYIFAVAWKDGLTLLFGNSASIYSEAGVVFVHTMVFFPLAMIIIGSALSQINAYFEEAGLMVVSFNKMLIKIVLPLVKPALNISFLLILIFSLSDFSVPAFFGVQTFTTEIFTQFSAFYNFPMAIGQSVLLLAICLLLMLAEARYLSDSPFFSISLKGSISKKYMLKKNIGCLHFALLMLLMLALILPVLLLVIQAFSGNGSYFSKAWQMLAPTVLPSLSIAFVASLIITLIGFVVAYSSAILKRNIPNNLLLLAFIIPSTVLGISLISYYNTPYANFIYGSSLIILLAYLGRFGFIASRILANGLKQIPAALSEAAAVAGIHPLRTFYSIALPLLTPSLFAAFILTFILCLGELGVVIMVYPPGTELLNIKTFTISANAPLALTSSMTIISLCLMALLIVFFVFAGNAVFKKYRYE